MDYNEVQIIEDCQKGELENFSILYDRYIKKIYDFIYFKTHHKETAEDLTSRTFMKALEKIASFDNARGNFSAWIYRIARNTVIDHYRTKKNDRDIDDIWDLVGNEDIERDVDVRHKLEKVEKYIGDLKSEQREIIIMRVWQEMSYKEIAEVLGKTEASCKMVFLRAVKKLKKELPLVALISLFLIKL